MNMLKKNLLGLFLFIPTVFGMGIDKSNVEVQKIIRLAPCHASVFASVIDEAAALCEVTDVSKKEFRDVYDELVSVHNNIQCWLDKLGKSWKYRTSIYKYWQVFIALSQKEHAIEKRMKIKAYEQGIRLV